MHRYLIVIEPTATGFAAYSPDLPGCIATAASRRDLEQRMREAVELHIEGLRAANLPVPRGDTSATWIEVAA